MPTRAIFPLITIILALSLGMGTAGAEPLDRVTKRLTQGLEPNALGYIGKTTNAFNYLYAESDYDLDRRRDRIFFRRLLGITSPGKGPYELVAKMGTGREIILLRGH